MIYFGSHGQMESSPSESEPTDEILVMQQHCGGENLIVHRSDLKPGGEPSLPPSLTSHSFILPTEQFTFTSRRHWNYPFGLSIYVKGFIDSRISTCCEYKHSAGVKLGGDRGHFAIVSVDGSRPCLR